MEELIQMKDKDIKLLSNEELLIRFDFLYNKLNEKLTETGMYDLLSSMLNKLLDIQREITKRENS